MTPTDRAKRVLRIVIYLGALAVGVLALLDGHINIGALWIVVGGLAWRITRVES